MSKVDYVADPRSCNSWLFSRELTILSTVVSKVDRTVDFQNFHPTTVDLSKKSLSTVDLWPKADCRLEGLLNIWWASVRGWVSCTNRWPHQSAWFSEQLAWFSEQLAWFSEQSAWFSEQLAWFNLKLSYYEVSADELHAGGQQVTPKHPYTCD
jgi:hypothetical protein